MMLHDISEDMLFMDGQREITLARRDGLTQGGILAIPRAISVREAAASNGRYLTLDVRWHIPVQQINQGTPAPLPGDTITDAEGTNWTILSVDRATLTTRYACVCRNLELTGGLNSLVTVQQATYSKGTYGEQVATWGSVSGLVNIKARIQPTGGSRSDDQGRLTLSPGWSVWIIPQFDAQPHHRIIAEDGRKFRVIGFNNPDDIGSLFQLDCEIDTSEV